MCEASKRMRAFQVRPDFMVYRRNRRAIRSRLLHLEPLEQRQLLSATWTTTELPSLPAPIYAMTSDNAGNVFAITSNAVVLEKYAGTADGTSSWATLTQISNFGVRKAVTDANGNLFLAGFDWTPGSTNVNDFAVDEIAKGSTTAVRIDTLNNAGLGDAFALVSDSAGKLYTGTWSYAISKSGKETDYWTVQKGTYTASTGSWNFTTVDQVAGPSNGVHDITVAPTVVNGVQTTAVYAAGRINSSWAMRRSTDGGATWQQVDTLISGGANLSGGNTVAWSVAADVHGNLYAAGDWELDTISGSGRKTTTTRTNYLEVRKSMDGGNTWTADDLQQYNFTEVAIAADLTGNVVLTLDTRYGYTSLSDALIRTNAGGSWHTIDDISGAQYYPGTLTVDAAGNIYAGGNTTAVAIVRSFAAAPANLTAAPDPSFPASQINLSWTNTSGSDTTGYLIYRSTDGTTFTQVASVGAGTPSYVDSGLAAGTTYYYYVVAQLATGGVSASSDILSASTSPVV